jgi:uncharacterized protein (TIGR02284 family)
MTLTTKDIINILEKLIETCEDGKKGYEDAATDVKDTNLNREFLQFSKQREQYREDLKEKINLLSANENVPGSGSISGLIHRGWMNLKSALSINDTKAILKEVIKGEESAVKNYEEALQNDLPGEINTMIRIQYSGIVEALDRMKSLSEYEDQK